MDEKGLLPPAGLEASMPEGLTPAERIALWADLVDASEELLKAGLRRKLLPGQTLEEAFREWLEREHEEHVRTLVRMREGILEMVANHARREAAKGP
jgi:hypothetical protein